MTTHHNNREDDHHGDYESEDLSVCVVCLHLLANGEYNDGTDAADIAAHDMEKRWGGIDVHLIPEGNELGFCTTSCSGCGTTDHGDRYTAVAQIRRRPGHAS